MEDGIGDILSKPEVIWFFVGLVLMLSEFIVPGIIVIFFGLGCWVTSATVMMIPGISFTLQLVIFLSSSVVLLLLLRNKARKWIGNEKENKGRDELLEEFIGKKAIAQTAFKEGGSGVVVFKGTTWEAESDRAIEAGAPVMIKAKESIKLIVEPI